MPINFYITALFSVLVVYGSVDNVMAAQSVPHSSYSQPSDNNKVDNKKQKVKRSPSINLKMHAQLQKAQFALSKDDDSIKAVALMESLKRKYDTFNDYERAVFWNMYAYIYYADEKFPKAQFAYEQVLAQANLPEALYTGTLYSLAQIHFLQEEYLASVAHLIAWFKVTEKPGVTAYVLLGQGYYQLNNYKEGISAIHRAVEITQNQGRQVKENWYLLLRAMYYRQEAYKETLAVLELLIREYPKKEYYAHIASIYAQLNKNFEQYSTFIGMADADLLDTGEELINYAHLLLQNKRPYRAARLLEKAFEAGTISEEHKNMRLLATAWILAKETKRSIPVLERAAKLSGSGEDYMLLAQSYFSDEKWAKAEKSIKAAFEKGRLKRLDSAHLLLGMTLFNRHQYDQSLEQFAKAKQDKRSRKIANQWDKYVRAERVRISRINEL